MGHLIVYGFGFGFKTIYIKEFSESFDYRVKVFF